MQRQSLAIHITNEMAARMDDRLLGARMDALVTSLGTVGLGIGLGLWHTDRRWLFAYCYKLLYERITFRSVFPYSVLRRQTGPRVPGPPIDVNAPAGSVEFGRANIVIYRRMMIQHVKAFHNGSGSASE